MKRSSVTVAVAVAGLLSLAGATPAFAHNRLEDDGALDSGKEVHEHDAQHGGHEGHLEPVVENVTEIANLDLFAGDEQPGRIADVSAKGDYAYLTAFWEPECDRGGVYVVDISNPAAPTEVALIPSHIDTFSGEGSQVVTLNTPSFKGDLLIYQNELCPGATNGVGGVTLVDVTDPTKPKKLVEGFGDFSNKGKSQTHSNQVHSAFAWQAGNRAYAVLVDDEEETDVDILDITNPSKPKLISETSLDEFSAQPVNEVHGDAVFLHDMVVKQIGGKQIMLASYWDGGFVTLDVTDPAAPKPLADTDFAAVDPVRAGFGETITPEGNAHQAEFTRDNAYFVATDEDFDPYRVQATMAGGSAFTAVQGSAVPQIDADTALSGGTRFIGLGCDPATIVPADDAATIAVIERGVCDFTVKVQNAQAAGYAGALVFNRTGVDGCDALVSMLVEADIPAAFISRTDAFRLLTGAVPADYTCNADGTGTPAPAAGTLGQSVEIAAVFDGWGYVHLYDATTMEEIDQYYIPESQDPDYASGFGDLSVHEVATDPDDDLVYVSYYTGGLRVLEYGPEGLNEVGAYIDEGGNNFWGVEVHDHPNGQQYVLASDRDSGLYIFQYNGG